VIALQSIPIKDKQCALQREAAAHISFLPREQYAETPSRVIEDRASRAAVSA